jgi:drug/metabolite transporter (DMT)-like permease
MQALWMVVATLLFAGMSACVKIASADFNAAEIVFYRGIIGMLVMWWLAHRKQVTLATRFPAQHAWRSFVGVISMLGWFYGIGHLPLATATTLSYMSSIWMAAFLVGAQLWARWRRPASTTPGQAVDSSTAGNISWRLVVTVLAGFAGVVIALRPNVEPQQLLAAGVSLIAGVFAAMAYMQVSTLSRLGEPEARTVFYFAVGSTVAGGLAMLLTGLSPWPGVRALWLLPVGILAALAQMCMTMAYASATNRRSTLIVANLNYLGIVFAALMGLSFFGESIEWWSWVGFALIMASGAAATALRARG